MKRVCLLTLACLLIAASLIPSVEAWTLVGSQAVFDCRVFEIHSGSMQPAFSVGDEIIVKPCKPEQVQKGDIITYDDFFFDTYITHRVTKILTELDGEQGLWFVTKGDSNPYEDFPPVRANQLVGKLALRLPGAGVVLAWIDGRPFIIAQLAILLLLSWPLATMLLFWLALRKRKRIGQAIPESL